MLYADEFQRFATPTFGRFLEEARKYAVATTLAHQHRQQLTTDYLRASVKGALNLDRLRQTVRNATRAEHLEGVEHNDATAQFTEREGRWRIEPE